MESSKVREVILSGNFSSAQKAKTSNIERFFSLVIIAKWADVTPGPFALASVNPSDNTLHKASPHGLVTGTKVQFTTTGTLPAGLALLTDYFVVKVSDTVFKVSDSLAHALAGTNIVDITDAGTGTHTVTATALTNAVLTPQMNAGDPLDETDWVPVPGGALALTGTDKKPFEFKNLAYDNLRVVLTMDAGVLQLESYVSGKQLAGS